jgi:outer membrane immunogenic protein
MKWLKLLLAGIGSVLAAGAVKAADLTQKPILKAPPAVDPMPAFSWTGCYAGLNGGGAWGRQSFNARSCGALLGAGDIHTQGAVLGGQVGCDQQFGGNWVIGLEGQFDGANMPGKFLDPFGAINTSQTNTRWLGSVTGRLGFTGLFPRTMAYVKGGAAWADESDDINTAVPALNGVVNQTVDGWTAGGGVAWAIDSKWSIFAEYDHYDFSRQNYTTSVNAGFPLGVQTLSINAPRIDTVEVGINYRFLGR